MRISDWSSDVCSSDLALKAMAERAGWSQNLAHVHPDNYVRTLKRRLCETIFARLRAAGCGKDRSLVDLAADLTGVAGGPIPWNERELAVDRKSTRMNYSHKIATRMPYSCCKKKHKNR